jgi:hypothetical protein
MEVGPHEEWSHGKYPRYTETMSKTWRHDDVKSCAPPTRAHSGLDRVRYDGICKVLRKWSD